MVWTPPKGHFTKSGTTHHRVLLRILRAWCKSPNKRILSYKDALQRTECESIETTVRTRRLLWSGALLCVIAPFFLSFLFSFGFGSCFHSLVGAFVDVPLIFSCSQPRGILLGMVEDRSGNVKNTHKHTPHQEKKMPTIIVMNGNAQTGSQENEAGSRG